MRPRHRPMLRFPGPRVTEGFRRRRSVSVAQHPPVSEIIIANIKTGTYGAFTTTLVRVQATTRSQLLFRS